jgi:hypothetical protein
MADPVPHPLVVSVALKLGQASAGDFKKSAKNFVDAASKARAGDEAAIDAATAADDELVDQKNALAEQFANQANLNGLSLFAGFLGGPVPHDGKTWRLIYLDSRLDSWLLVQETDIVVHERLPDDNAPSRRRDVLWVNATANLVRGNGPRTNDGRFLVGELTRAGDFAASTGGGTFSAASGLLCEATTPGCCVYTRTRCGG